MNELTNSNAGKIGRDPLLDFPAFKHPIPLCKPFVPRREKFFEYINDILDRQWFTNEGLYVQDKRAYCRLRQAAYVRCKS